MIGPGTWTTDETRGLLRDYITREFLYDRPDIQFDDACQLVEQGLIDSIRMFRLVSFLETTFGFTVAPQDITRRNFETVEAIGALVQAGLDRAKGSA